MLGQVRDALNKRSTSQIDTPGPDHKDHQEQEPPVVAQLMIEIRSDGSRTIARGALNDLLSGESARVHAEGRTPRDLMLSLAGSLLSLPTSFGSSSWLRGRHKQIDSKRNGNSTSRPMSTSTSASPGLRDKAKPG